jgi:aspartyl-tRNA synthetase
MSGFNSPHCGLLRAHDVGNEVDLYGWVARRRDHGGVTFIDLRDRWGPVQVVLRDTQHDQLRLESVVHVHGTVSRRPTGSENPKMATGEVEVVAANLEVISVSEPTPFPIEDPEEPDEKTRLVYRYLDLRRPQMTRMLELRNRVNRIIRDYMEAREFVEVETPILTRSSPSRATFSSRRACTLTTSTRCLKRRSS